MLRTVLSAQGAGDSPLPLAGDTLQTIEVSSAQNGLETTATLSRNQFLSMAGALEDPTRLLIKYPGVSTANDQANSIIYRGMPSHFHRWSLHGARILNPNHLGNAGTVSDFPTRSSGGVNMFSGQVIGSLDFSGQPSGQYLDALGANSNIKLRDPYKNAITSNLSLIGLELGIDRMNEKGNKALLVNYRYSTVGLLTSLGLDFGGEVINYQDATLKYHQRYSNGDQLTMYAIAGFNSNNKDAVVSEGTPETFKDVLDITYDATNIIGGIQFQGTRDKFHFENTLNISYNNINRIAERGTPSIGEETTTLYENDEFLIASRHILTTKKRSTTFGLSFEPYLHSIDLQLTYPTGNLDSLISRRFKRTSLHVIPSFFANWKLDEKWTLFSKLGMQAVFSDENDQALVGQMGLRFTANRYMSSIRISRASQLYQPELLFIGIPAKLYVGINTEWTHAYKGLQLMLFYHRLSNLPTSTANYGFSAFDNLENMPIINSTLPILLATDGKAEVYGLSVSTSQRILGMEVGGNATIMDSRHHTPNEITRAPLDYGYLFNVRLSKKWQFQKQKEIGLSISFHQRGGSRQSKVNNSTSFDWGYTNYEFEDQYSIQLADYQRMDLRISYKPSERSTLSLDIQNVLNRENEAFYFYDPIGSSSQLNRQLGMIPILSWRVDW